MSLLTPTTFEVVNQAFVEHCCLAYQMDHEGYQGFDHWMRVLHNGRLLVRGENANLKVVELFCLLYDDQRHNEKVGPQHGQRVAQFAGTLRGV